MNICEQLREAADRLAWWLSQPKTDSQRGESIRAILEDIRELKKELRRGER